MFKSTVVTFFLLAAALNLIYADVTHTNITIQETNATVITDNSSVSSSSSAATSTQTIKVIVTKPAKSSTAQGATCSNDKANCTGALQQIRKAIVSFTFKFLFELLKYNRNETIVGSPISTMYLIGQLAIYSYGTTYSELMMFLNLKSKDEIRCTLKRMNNLIDHQHNGVQYLVGTNVVADYQKRFTHQFKEDMIDVVGGKATNYNFDTPKRTMMKLNRQIAKQTKNRVINTITSPEIFNKNADLIFATGVFFESEWQIAFEKNNLTTRDFYEIHNRIIQVPYVYQKGIYKYILDRELQAQVVEIPFRNNFFTCLLLLPNTKCGLKPMVKKLQDPDLFQRVYNAMKPTCVELYLPEFSNASSTIDNVEILKKTGGIDSIFDRKTAQTETPSGLKRNFSLSAGRQKVVLNNIVTVTGVEQPQNDECLGNTDILKQVVIDGMYPLVFVILNKGIPILCGAGKLITS